MVSAAISMIDSLPAILQAANVCGVPYRYLYEAGNRRAVIELVEIALEVADDNLDGAGRAHLLNTLGVTHMSFNDLPACRKALLESQMIREQKLDPSDEELANTYLNLGNLEAAEGKQDEAIAFFEKSLSIRCNIPSAKGMVAVCHLTIARALLNKRDFEPALDKMRISQEMFEEVFGKEAYNHLL
jgi:tetratricopeptide (TPR) repeat protein